MLDGLVAVCIVAHVHHLHLSDLMDGETIIAIVEDRRKLEYGVEHLVESVFTTHEAHQALRVVEYRPGVVPSIALGEGITPLQWIEGSLELSIQQSAAHQTALLVEHFLIVLSTLGKRLQLLLRFAQGFTKLIDTPVVVSILQGASHALIDLHIIRHIAQLVVILITITTCRVDFRMNSVGTMHHCLPKGLDIIATQAREISIGHHRG